MNEPRRNQYQPTDPVLMGYASGNIANRWGCWSIIILPIIIIGAILFWLFVAQPIADNLSNHYDYRNGWTSEPKTEHVIETYEGDQPQEVTPTYEDEQYNYNMQDAQEDAYNSLNEDVYNQ